MLLYNIHFTFFSSVYFTPWLQPPPTLLFKIKFQNSYVETGCGGTQLFFQLLLECSLRILLAQEFEAVWATVVSLHFNNNNTL